MSIPTVAQAPLSPDLTPQTPDQPGWFSLERDDVAANPDHHLVVCGEEKGGTDTLPPVLEKLFERGVAVSAYMAGRGIKVLERAGFQLEECLPPKKPDALLFTPSNDGRLELDLRRKFSKVPCVGIEDHFESSRYMLGRLANEGLGLPTVCVIDGEARNLINRRFNRRDIEIVQTGSPAMDELATEDRPAKKARIQAELGIEGKKLVTFRMPDLGHIGLAELLAREFEGMDDDILFAIRPHPRDIVPDHEFDRVFRKVNRVNILAYNSDDIGSVSEIEGCQRSTSILKAAGRGLLTFATYDYLNPEFTIPTVDSGATLGVRLAEQPGVLSTVIPELLDGTSERCEALRTNTRAYTSDGQAAARVAEVVFQAMNH